MLLLLMVACKDSSDGKETGDSADLVTLELIESPNMTDLHDVLEGTDLNVRIWEDAAGCPGGLAMDDPEGGTDLYDLPDGMLTWCLDDVAPTSVLEQDHLGVAATTSTLEINTLLAEHDANTFTDVVGTVSVPSGYASPVELAILDTSPTSGHVRTGKYGSDVFVGFDTWTSSPHGAALANLAGTILCGPGGPTTSDAGEDCAARVHTRLALPISTLDDPSASGFGTVHRDYDLGGSVGSILDLARAVVTEARQHLATYGTGRGLVINISAGFGPRWAKPDGDSFGNDTKLLYKALVYARCSGALIFAAEGNADHAGEGNETLLPAGWADQATPAPGPLDPSACVLYGPGGFNSGSSQEWAYGPLVFPVGGLKADDDVLGDALAPANRSTLRAYGDHTASPVPGFAVRNPSDVSGYTTPMSGSSVATLVASATVAARWATGTNECKASTPAFAGTPSTLPLTSDLLMDSVMADCGGTSASVGTSVITGPLAGGGSVFKLSPATAFQPCSGSPYGMCSATTSISTSFPDVMSYGTADVFECWELSNQPACYGGDPEIGEVYFCDATPPTGSVRIPFDCPDQVQFSTAAHPFVLPQPSPPYCPSCLWDSGQTKLYVEGVPLSQGATGVAASLGLKSASGVENVYGGFKLDWNQTAWITVTGVPASTVPPDSARLMLYQGNTLTSVTLRVK